MCLAFQPEATFRDPAFSTILSSNRVDPAALLVIAVQDRERGAGQHCRAGFSPYGVNEEGYGGLGSGRIGDDRHPFGAAGLWAEGAGWRAGMAGAGIAGADMADDGAGTSAGAGVLLSATTGGATVGACFGA